MKIATFFSVLSILVIDFCFAQNPPVAPVFSKAYQKHGDRRVDNYYWLRDVSDPKTIDYIKKENAYTEAVMKPTNSLQEKLYKEMLSKINQIDTTLPQFKNGYWYYVRFQKGKEFEFLCRKEGSMSNQEEVILDVNKLSRKNSEMVFEDYAVSSDNKTLAYLKDIDGEGNYLLSFRKIGESIDLTEEIPNVTSFAWANDGKTIFYVTQDSTGRSTKVFRHFLGNKISEDIVVYDEKDVQFDVTIEKSKSDEYIFISTGSEIMGENETWLIDAKNPQTKQILVNSRQKEHLYFVQHFGGDKLYILSDKNSPNYRLCETTIAKPEFRYWNEIVPHNNEELIWDYLVTDDYIALNIIKNANSIIKIINRKLNSYKIIDFGFEKDCYWAVLLDFNDSKKNSIRLGYSSLVTPVKLYSYEFTSATLQLQKSAEVVGSYDKNLYKTERFWIKSSDGVSVPATIVYKTDLFQRGDNPMLINVYGGYGISNEPYFSSIYLSLLNRGFIFVKAHVRGGSEMGRNWYSEGKRLKKKNGINDFVAIAEYFLKENYTQKNRLFAEGYGIGGMLLAASMNQKPDLCRAIIFDTPNLDILTTLLETEQNEVNQDFDEIGNPNSQGTYEYIKSYSPYDNIAPKPYPSMLFLSPINDKSVGYWESAKFVAKVRVNNNGDNPILLKTEFKRNDGGRYSSLDNFAFKYAFIFKLIGIKE